MQYTRNPEGIAGALKRIGGVPAGGLVANAHSQEAAHFFFANALRSGRMSLFATHPPLAKRIQAIEPGWDGAFVSGERRQSARRAAPSEARATPPPLSAQDFMSSVGQVSAAAIIAAQAVHSQVGNDLDRLHQSPDSARGVLLGLQISASSEEDDASQLLQVKERVDAAVHGEAEAWLPRLRALNINQRFALFDAALPMAAGKDLAAFRKLSALSRDLADSDGEVNLEELALLRASAVFLDERTSPARMVFPQSPEKMRMPLCVLLSIIAYATGQEESGRIEAFKEGARVCAPFLREDPILLAAEEITFESLEEALDLFVHLPPPQKKIVFEGALAVVLSDGKVEAEELSLIRVIATSLALPMPPMMSASVA